MKKIALLLVVVFTLGLLLSACRSSKKTSKSSCPAYGEYKQYQRESVY